MNCGLKKSTGAWVKALAFIVLFATVLPDLAARLCIAPDSHIAIEGMDSDCCGSRNVSYTAEKDSRNYAETDDDCGCCTDLPIVSFGPETIETVQCATGIPAFENPDILAAADFPAPLSERDGRTVCRAPAQVSSSLPLLC